MIAGLDLLEGQCHPITWKILQIVDNDNLDAVQRLVVEGNKDFEFGVKDLRDGVVHYHHDSDTAKDEIVFRIFDGKHSLSHNFFINILPKDDTPPFLVNHLVLDLKKSETVLIENYILMAADFDLSDDYIFIKYLNHPALENLSNNIS
ncbi:UNVERIFIED_CONTAM: hypothetical protein K2H54_052181 [Gekko kuhli]